MISLLILLQTTVTIAVAGPATSPEYLPLRVAQAEGYFAAEQLNVTLQSTRAEATAAEALARGQAALAATSLDAALTLGHDNGALPRLVFGFTAAPPVAVLVSTAHKDSVRSVKDLLGKTIAVPAPGTSEHLLLLSLLARARLRVPQVSLLSYGERGVAGALESGQAAAGVVGDPYATRLIEEGKATALVDMRARGEPARRLGGPVVHAALFARADTTLGVPELTPLARALLRAAARIQAATPEELAAKLPRSVVGSPDDFAIRLRGAREIFLPDGWVSKDMLADSVALVRERSLIPAKVAIPRGMAQLLLTDPLKQALDGKRP